MSSSSPSSSSDFARRFACSSLSVAVATAATNPIDVVKVNLQIDKTSSSPSHTLKPAAPASSYTKEISRMQKVKGKPSGAGFFGTAAHLFQNEGVWGFTKGMEAALSRSVVYGGVRIGCYNPLKKFFKDGRTSSNVNSDEKKQMTAQTNVFSMMAAGISAGAVATIVSNPLDLIKTRQQAPPSKQASTVVPTKPSIVSIVRSEGVFALWKGVLPASVRASVLTASQCVTYDVVKHFLIHGVETHPLARSITNSSSGFIRLRNMEDGLATHVTTSMVTGLVSTTLTNPVDVVKTRMFVEGGSGIWSIVAGIYNREGVRGFLKGWSANYIRLGPQTMLIFVVFENLKWIFGIDAL